ncbi:MAG: 50S ribosomal protein L11 [Candidatus Pacebacteria bacterium]|nr:50S ribosomal protein L11 [Candidatus Paceibacterota bacterium]
MSKKIKSIIKLQIKAGQATPAPPVGPALAPHGINIGEFCQRFNDMTKEQMGAKIPIKIIVYEDRTYELEIKQPLASELLKQIAGIEKGSGKPDKVKVAKITRAQLKEVAQRKMADLNANDIDQAMKIIEGTAKNMGIEIE